MTSWKELITFTWPKGFLLVGFFLFVSLLNLFIYYDWLFIIFFWPLYLLPQLPLIAITIELLYVYSIISLVLSLIKRVGTKK